MSGFLQVLGVCLAMVASGAFVMAAFITAPEVRGRRDARPVARLTLHGLAVFWLTAALVAMTSPKAVITPINLFAVAVFAGLGIGVLAWALAHRPAPSPARREGCHEA